MLANDILRKIRYSLDLKDKEMKLIFQAGDPNVQDIKLYTLLKKEDEKEFVLCSQALLNTFLNGLIIFYRGASDKPPVPAPKVLSNNDVLRKIRIALTYQEKDMLEVFTLSGMEISKSELSSFFRRKNHKHYQECGDQFLRYFLQGLSLYKKKVVRRIIVSPKKTGNKSK